MCVCRCRLFLLQNFFFSSEEFSDYYSWNVTLKGIPVLSELNITMFVYLTILFFILLNNRKKDI